MIQSKYELVGGPKDGCHVKSTPDCMPTVIFLSPQPSGDGYEAWGRVASDRFPCCYKMDLHSTTRAKVFRFKCFSESAI